ncbi:MAG: aspartate kinase [Rhodocyclaceae bacterium]|nr:aspartate kinase [Rhodocyclaceae bacterium]
MWVVKLGGSLAEDPLLVDWLEVLTDLGGGRVIIVPGGGSFADCARRAQTLWQFDDVAGHNMAVLGMAQFAFMLNGLHGELEMCASEQDMIATMRRGQVALWMPLGLLRQHADELTSWRVTSDSLALWLARRLNAERVVLVKACEIPPFEDWGELADRGIVDHGFPELASDSGNVVSILERTALPTMRAMLLDAHTPCALP